MDVTDLVGGFGPWQRTILLVVVFRSVPISYVGTGPIFYVANTDYWCARPDSIPWTADEWRTKAIPEENGVKSKCSQYVVHFNKTEEPVIDMNRTVVCDEWEYSEEYGNTIIKEFSLVCADGWKSSLTHTLLKLGNLVGFVPAGYLTDRFGRKQMAVWSLTAIVILNTASAFSPSYLFFIILRFFVGISYSCASTSSLCLLLEVLGPDQRPKISFSFMGGWGAGMMIVSGLYWLDQDWRHSLLILTIPFTAVTIALIWRLVPESIRWLLIMKKDVEAEMIVADAAQKNHVQLDSNPEVYMTALKDKIYKESSEGTTVSFVDLFKTRIIRKWTIVLMTVYFVIGFVYFGFMLTIQAIGANLYLAVFLLGFCEVLAVSVFMFLSNRYRRRRSLLGLSLFSCVFYLASIPVPNELIWLRLLLSMIGRFSNIVTYNFIWIVAAEIFPTSHRTLGINLCMTSGRVGTVFSTFLLSVAQAAGGGTWLLVLFGVLMGLSSLLYLILPETKDKHLPDTILATKSLQEIKKAVSLDPKPGETT